MDDYWGKQIHVTKEAARRQVEIYTSFPVEKRMQIAAEFFDLGVNQTRAWIKREHPEFTETEITLEYVRLTHFLPGHMKPEHWAHFEKVMRQRITGEGKDKNSSSEYPLG